MATSIILALSLLHGRVVHVADGDTVTLLVDDRQVKIRLVGIDAPERRQPFGTVAGDRLKELVHGKFVVVQPCGLDRYGRTLGVVWVDGFDVNEVMISEGLAWRYRDDRRYSHEAAKRAGVGLWSDRNSVPPWEWRKQRTVNASRP